MSEFSINKVTNSAILPKYDDGVFTFFVDIPSSVGIPPGKTVELKTGVSVEIPKNRVFVIGMASLADGLVMPEGVKFITSSKVDNLTIRIHNNSNTARIIKRGSPIAKGIILPVTKYVNKED